MGQPSPPEQVNAVKARRSLCNGFITLILEGALIVGLLLAVPGLSDVAATVSHMKVQWVLIAVLLEALSCASYVLAFLQLFNRAPFRVGARVALSEEAFGAAVSLGGVGSLATPRRGRVLGAKAAAAALVGFVYGTLAGLVATGTALVFITAHHDHVALGTGTLVAHIRRRRARRRRVWPRLLRQHPARPPIRGRGRGASPRWAACLRSSPRVPQSATTSPDRRRGVAGRGDAVRHPAADDVAGSNPAAHVKAGRGHTRIRSCTLPRDLLS